jgi:phosphohistidine phosphatase SixA
MYKQFALTFYFSVISAAFFFSCKNDVKATDGSSSTSAAASAATAAPVAKGPVASDAFETAVSYENGKFKTASGKEIAVPMYGDAKAITFYIVRHAEAAAPGMINADSTPIALTLEGQQRASRLGAVLKGARVDYIASTNVKRNMETGKLLYHHLGSPPFQSFPPEMMQTWLTDILGMGGGRGYVHVGHSNTIPQLAQLLHIKEPFTIAENDFANLIVIAVKGDKGEMVRLRYQ